MNMPCGYSRPEGPVHKRGEITGKGWFVGIQWPGVFVKRNVGKLGSAARVDERENKLEINK